MAPPLRALLFDIDDTLYSTSAFAEGARRRAMEAMVGLGGLGVTAEELLAELREVIAEFGSNYDAHYDRLLRRFPVEALGGHSRAMLVTVGVAAYHDAKMEGLRPFPGVREGLESLRTKTSLRLGVVTEGLEIKQLEKIHRLGVYGFLDRDAIFVSDAIGISKPNPKLWQRACDVLGVGPEEALYVGDHPVKDIPPARSIGMRTVRFRSSGGKCAALEGPHAADHEVASFEELLSVLRKAHGLAV